MSVPREHAGTLSTWRVGDVVDGLYEVADVIGRGGMGVVYRVRHLMWGVDLAVKCPRPALFRTEAARRLFITEAETWVSLGLHPHVCGCHYVRTLGGIPRVFAEYVPGGSLRDWVDDRRLYRGDRRAVLARILDVAVQMAWGLDHAHSRQLVHQDMKPDNVLLDDFGTAKITDFGLALARDAAAKLRPDVPPADPDVAPPGVSILVPGGGGGTQQYASPEQAEHRPLGRRTDVYSFAVSVLEMFTGGPVWHDGPEAGAALDGCRGDGMAGLPAMPSGLADLLARCLHRDPARRPGSMAEVVTVLAGVHRDVVGVPYPRKAPVAADLRAGELNNRSLSLLDLGRPDEAEQALKKALAADPQNVAARYNAGLARWRAGAVTDQELVAEMEALRADRGDAWEASHLLAQVHLERGDLASAGALLEGVPPEWRDEPDIQATLHAVRSGRITDARCVDEWEIAWPPYPQRESTHGGEPASREPGALETVRQAILSAPSGSDFATLPVTFHDDAALSLTPDGRLALTGTWDGKVRLWDVRTGRCLKVLEGHRKPIQSVDLTPGGGFAVSADKEGTVWFWNLADERASRECAVTSLDSDRSGMQLARVCLSQDGRAAYWPGADGGFRFLDTGSGEQRQSRAPQVGRVRLVRTGALRRRLLGSAGRGAGWDDRSEAVGVWDLDTGLCRHVLTGHTSYVTALCLSADERFAATGSHDRTIRIWDLTDGSCVRVLTGHTADTLSLSPDAKFLLSGDAFDGTVRFWDIERGRCLRTFPGHEHGTAVVVLDPECRFALSAGQDRRVRRWRLPTVYDAAPSLTRPRPHTELSRLGTLVDSRVAEAEQAMAEGRFPAALCLLTEARKTAGYEREPNVLSAWWALSRHLRKTGLRAVWSPRVLVGHGDYVGAVDVSGDGRVAVSGCGDGTVRAWAVDTGDCTRVLEGHEDKVESVCLSPDGRQVLSGSRDGTVRLWSLETGACQLVLGRRASLGESAPLRFSADGRQAVVGHNDGHVRIWDLGTGREARSPWRHRVDDIATASDGSLAAFARGDLVQLYDLRRAESTRILRGEFLHTMRVVCLSADGGLALTGEAEGIRLWDTASGEVVRSFSTDDPLGAGRDLNHFLCMTAKGDFAVSGGFRTSPVVWDVTTGRRLRALDGHETGVTCLAMTPDGRFVLSGSVAGSIRVWELDWELAARETAD
ncbi:protein kinase domain-containing protein [Streptomyces gibsoniae]|uniref:Protein kinase n=1 Tax=Streptomyces gibsoniae TaxID=3075529 RepID=A0ABU2U3R5_9ACTN|nr:protein kinase [Streptomyces sp. DSM 41699]MDT0467873.1 protein kinase [Streptomyces sp. DSM 41699]